MLFFSFFFSVVLFGGWFMADTLTYPTSQTEFARILQSRAVVPKLNELETLLLDAQARKEGSDGGPAPVPYVYSTSLSSPPGSNNSISLPVGVHE